jgi:hypothetical protein
MTSGARVLLVATLTTQIPAPHPPDAARVLADMRQALGGDALKSVETFSVKGSEERFFGEFRTNAQLEWVGILPDRFIEERRLAGSTTITTGFNGDAVVREFKGTPGGRGRFPVPGEPPKLSEATRHNMMILAKQHFSRVTVAMFGLTPVYPLDAAYISREMLDEKPVHLLELSGPNDYVARLCVDVSSHLPRMISWMGRPVIPVLSVFPGTLPEPSMVEHRLYFSHYEKSDGLNWPHRIKEVVAKMPIVEIRLGKFKINSKIDPSRFEPKH